LTQRQKESWVWNGVSATAVSSVRNSSDRLSRNSKPFTERPSDILTTDRTIVKRIVTEHAVTTNMKP
jgi:hypothetical protein